MDALLNASREIRCVFSRSDPELLRARWFTIISLGVANVIGAVITFTVGVLAFPAGAITADGLRLLGVATGVYLFATLVIGSVVCMRIALHTEELLTSPHDVSLEELRKVLNNQWRQTRQCGLYWLGGAAMVAILLGPVLHVEPALVARDVMVVLLGGLTTCASAFLLLERGLRPVVTRLREVLSDVTACAPTVRARLLLAWLLGSGIPLLGIALALVEQPDSNRTRLVILLGILTGVGIVIGAYTSILAAGSVADPLRTLHRTMERVAAGDLSATVPIADSGEIGDLQLRFNRMTAGLREREQLRELFGRHVGADVARYAMENSDLGGEQREVSVLFIDIKGSTSLAERLSPVRVVAMLNDLFTAVVAAVEAQGGWANKFEGDAALCIFGAPIPQPDHATSALRAARNLAGDVQRLRVRHPGLDVGIAVASGTVVAGNVGSARRYEYTVIGDPVNLAARLCEQAKDTPSRVMVDAASVEMADPAERSHWQSCGEIPLRGRRRSATVYQPVGVPSASEGAAVS